MPTHSLKERPVHLGLGATAEVEPVFTHEMSWYADYIARHDSDGAEARLVTLSTFRTSWDTWEMHPQGAEMVLCTAGEIIFHQEAPDGRQSTVTVKAGDYIINEPGVWHTADVASEATALFITAGRGTEHRPR